MASSNVDEVSTREERLQFQSVTGRVVSNFLTDSSSSLFYTVSGPDTKSQSKYYVEQLGCPSILKPSFRDLPGSTRLSVNVPSRPYHPLLQQQLSLPLVKLGRTMGKTSTAVGTVVHRNRDANRGERYSHSPPIKVNAKIRHIYSHFTPQSNASSSTEVVQSPNKSTASSFTQTEDNESEGSSVLPKLVGKSDTISKRDVSTSVSPPPPILPSSSEDANNPLLSVPPGYLGKLEDLEKITGHIVIQRFFTRADHAFGVWLEKQLGMNVKSVGVGEEIGMIEQGDAFVDEGVSRGDERVRSARKLRESRLLEKIEEMEDVLPNDNGVESSGLLVQEASLSPAQASNTIKSCCDTDLVKCECCKESNPMAVETLCVSEGVGALTDLDKEIISQSMDFEIKKVEGTATKILETDSRFEEDAIVNPNIPQDMPATSTQENIVAEILIRSRDQDTSLQPDSEEIDNDPEERPCIPDVIDVSCFYKTETEDSIAFNTTTTTTNNEDSDDVQTVVSLNPDELVDTQHKVSEYLGKLDVDSCDEAGTPFPMNTSTPSDLAPSESIADDGKEILSPGGEERMVIKRSTSVDSCIGTESSGERNALNDSSVLLDSGRLDEEIPEEPGEGEIIANSSRIQQLQDTSMENNVYTEEIDKASFSSFPPLQSTESIDEVTNYSSFAMAKQTSDEGDADQSECNSEDEDDNSFQIIPTRNISTVNCNLVLAENTTTSDGQDDEIYEMDGVVVGQNVDEDEDVGSEEDDELDQFDTIIENHEKEKRLRPLHKQRNTSTQTTQTVELSDDALYDSTPRSSTATTDSSSFDLEVVSKSKKYTCHSNSKKNRETMGDTDATTVTSWKRRSYLPTGSSGLNVLNMKFSMGRDFESEVSIRIPPKAPMHYQKNTKASSSISMLQYENIPNAIRANKNHPTATTSSRIVRPPQYRHEETMSATSAPLLPLIPAEKARQQAGPDVELTKLWGEVRSKMENKVDTDSLHVVGNRMTLGSSIDVGASQDTTDYNQGTKLPPVVGTEADNKERIKRSLLKLRKILDE